MKKSILFFTIISIIFFSCNSKKNQDLLLNTEWYTNDSLCVIKDSIITIESPYFRFDEKGDTEKIFESFKILSVNENTIIFDKESNQRDTILYDIKVINEIPRLLLIFNKKEKIMAGKMVLLLSPKEQLELKETMNFKTPNIEINGYQIGDTISLDSIGYIHTIGIPDTYFSLPLLSKPDIHFHIIGDKIAGITRTNIPTREVYSVVEDINKQTGIKPVLENETYKWEQKHFFISLRLDNDNYFLVYKDYLKQIIIEVEFEDNLHFKEIEDLRRSTNEDFLFYSIEEQAMGNDEKILRLTELISKNNQYYEVYLMRGKAKIDIENYYGATQDFESCIKLNPYNYESSFFLMQLYFNNNQYDEFKYYANKSIDLNKNETLAYRLLADYSLNILNDEKAACDFLNKAYDNGDVEVLKFIKDLCN